MQKKYSYSSVLLLLILLFSCSRNNDGYISFKNINSKKIPSQIIHDVVLINQNDTYSCATTSLAMILSEYKGLHNNPLNKDDIWKASESSVSTIQTLGNDLEGLYKVCNIYGSRYEFIQDLKNEEVEYLLSKNIFMIVFVSINENRTHAFILTGYDRNIKVFYANDTNGQKMVIPYNEFDKHWNAMLSHPRILSERGALVVYPDNVQIKNGKLRK